MTATAISPERRAELARAARGERRQPEGPVPMGIQVRTSASKTAGSDPADVRDEVLPVSEVLKRAQTSESARTRTIAEKVGALLADLTKRVQSELDAARVRADAEKAREALAAQEAELAQRLAEVRQQLRTTGRTTGQARGAMGDVDPKVVRAWAAEAGVECNDKGRVPQRVVDAWRAATAGAGVSQ